MRILFMMPDISGRYGKPSSPPVGMAYLAAFLRDHGCEVKAIDMRVESKEFDYISEVKAYLPDFVCLSFMSSDYEISYNMISEIRSAVNAKIVVGGAHTSVLRGKILEECLADFAVYREGEHALLELVQGTDLNSIKNLIWRDGEEIVVNPPRDPVLDLDSLPFPDYEIFKMDNYNQKRIPINTARGCPHLCTYCAVDRVIGRRFRTRSPKNVVDEIELWYKKGYKNFGFNDSTFTENMKRAGEIADEILKRNIIIEWDLRTGIRVDRVNKELLEKLKRAGCIFIAFGIESIDDGVLKLMKKGTNYEKVERALEAAKEVGIAVGGFFMIGTPGDTYEKFQESYKFADRDIFEEVRFYNTLPYPGTELYEWIENNAKFIVKPEEYLNSRSRWDEIAVFETDTFSAVERKKAFNEGEYLVAKKLAIKVLGKKLAPIVYKPCLIKFVRKVVLFAGFEMAPFVFKLLERKRLRKTGSR
jgi:radical SAM superfamily enzyme YgiQ (UPF0313 family)